MTENGNAEVADVMDTELEFVEFLIEKGDLAKAEARLDQREAGLWSTRTGVLLRTTIPALRARLAEARQAVK